MQRQHVAAMLAVFVAVALIAGPAFTGDQAVGPYKDFKGTIKLDIRDSKAD